MPIKIGQWLRWFMQMGAWADKFPVLSLLKKDCDKHIQRHPNCKSSYDVTQPVNHP